MTASSSPPPEKLTYSDAGVNIDAGNALVRRIAPLARATSRRGADAALGGFGGLFDLKAAGFEDPILVAATDGVGTKLKIAIETGRLDTVGIDLVAMCVNDLLAQGAEPLFFLDYFATAALDVDAASHVVAGIAEGCRQAGAALIGGETAEMPGMYAPGDFDLAGFAVGATERGTLLPRPDIHAGDVVLGLASSGVHSNGLSLVRKVAERAGLGWNAPAPFAPDLTLGAELLTPTRIYVKPLLPLIREGKIKALAHITGGGLPENVPRVLPDGITLSLDADGWDWKSAPPVFKWLMKVGNIPPEEMLRTFNCGVGMVAICAEGDATDVARVLESAGERVLQLGRLQERRAAGAGGEAEVRP